MERQTKVRKLIPRFLVIVTLMGASTATAQNLERDKIGLRTRLVLIDVLVTEKRTGTVVDDLSRDNFEVIGDRKSRLLAHFSTKQKRRPLALVLVLDLSPYNTGRFLRQPDILESLAGALSKLSPRDETAIIATWVKGVARNKKYIVEFTSDHAKVREELLKVPDLIAPQPVSVESHVTVPELLFEAAELTAQKPDSKVLMVYLSDKLDLTSPPERQQGAELAQKENITFSAILSPERKAPLVVGAPFLGLALAIGLRLNPAGYFAEQTGGLAIRVHDPQEYGKALEKIIEGISHSYTLGFELDPSEPDDGRLHRLEVKVKAADKSGKQRNLEVVARRGYFLPKPGEAVAQQTVVKETGPITADQSKRQTDEQAIRKSVYDLHYSVMTGDIEGVKRLTAKRTLGLYQFFFDLAFKKISNRDGGQDIPASSGDEMFKLVLGFFAEASKDSARAEQIREKARAKSECRITFTGDRMANIEYSDGISAKAVFEDGRWKIDDTEKLKEQLLGMELFTPEQKEQIRRY